MAFSFAFATIIILSYCAWMILNSAWLKPKKLEKFLRQQGFSGNSYKLLFGDIKEMYSLSKEARTKPIGLCDDSAKRILPFEHHIINKYGKKSFVWMGPNPSINITDPKLIREIFLNHEIFQKTRKVPFLKLLLHGMLMYEGAQWSKVRKIANPAFHQDKLKDMLPNIYLSCNEMISKLRMISASKEESFELDMWPHIQTLTADVISRTAFGSSYEDGRKIFAIITDQINLLTEALRFIYIPGWRYFPTRTSRKMKRNHKELRELIKDIINKREEELKFGKCNNNDDLLGLLLESNHKQIQENETGMSIEEVIDECKLFYVAGQETTASLIVWTMILLCMHPHWQELAREEVFQVLRKNQEPKFDDLNQLKIVTKIIYEALRLFTPVPLFVRRISMETKLGEIILPPGIEVSVPTIFVHHDQEYWGEDAKEFNPNRFSEGVSKASKSNQVSFFPFSGGPRICIGQNFALVEAKLALAMILQTFSFQLSPTYAHAPVRAITVHPQYGAQMILHKL